MKTIISYLSGLCMLMFALTGCEDSYMKPDEGQIPLATEIACDITVDQSTNEVTFRLNNPKCNPIWVFDEKDYSTVNGLTRVFAVAGTYQVEVKISNAHGVSDGSIRKEFTVENTLIDFSRYIKMFAGDTSKEWILAKEESGHLGCGEPGSDGTGWWSASPNEKAEFGVYDNVMTFDTDQKYTFDPGESGTVYVNTGCTGFDEFNTTGEDFTMPISASTVDYDFTVIGNDVYLVLPAKAHLPYIPNDAIYQTPMFKILSMKNNRIELVADNQEIAWHYTLVTKTQEASREDKMAGTWVWAKDQAGHLSCGEPGSDGTGWWSAMPNEKEKFGIYTHTFTFGADGSYTFNPGESGTFYVNKDCTKFPEYNTSGEDFNVPTDIQKGTWKFTDEGADTYLEFPAQTIVGYVANDLAWDTPKFKVLLQTETDLKFVIDNGEIAWQYHFVKEGSGDGDGDIDDDTNWDPTSSFNLWNGCTFTNSFYYAPEWTQIADPELTVNDKSYVISLPQATFQQWQAQVFFHTSLSTASDKSYDFRCVLNSNQDLSNITVKLFKNGDNDTFFFAKVISLTADEDYDFKMPKMTGLDIDKIDLVFDFGGNPANTTVTVSEVLLKDATQN